jgi:hypothetical protein
MNNIETEHYNRKATARNRAQDRMHAFKYKCMRKALKMLKTHTTDPLGRSERERVQDYAMGVSMLRELDKFYIAIWAKAATAKPSEETTAGALALFKFWSKLVRLRDTVLLNLDRERGNVLTVYFHAEMRRQEPSLSFNPRVIPAHESALRGWEERDIRRLRAKQAAWLHVIAEDISLLPSKYERCISSTPFTK